MKREQQAHLGGQDHDRHTRTVLPDLGQRGLGGQIVVPEVVMNDLLRPGNPAGFGIERYEACVQGAEDDA